MKHRNLHTMSTHVHTSYSSRPQHTYTLYWVLKCYSLNSMRVIHKRHQDIEVERSGVATSKALEDSDTHH